MKNFLKSTAIFACMAYLFCACTEDGTVDADIPMVDPSQITAVLSGDSRALIQWEVPDDQNITECLVTWKNNKNVNEIEYVPVIPGYSAEIEFYDLTEGDYDLTITNLGDNRAKIDTQGTSLEGTYIYSSVTYPNRPNVMRVLTESDAITITWSQIPQHCRGLYITYTDTADVTKTTPLQATVVNPTEIETSVGTTTVQTKLNDAKPGSDFYYVTTFKPLEGLDTVYLAASETPSVISEYVAANPENLDIQGGCDPVKYTTYSAASANNGGNTEGNGAYMRLKWKVPSADSIIYTNIYYNLLDDNGSVIEENMLTFGMEGEFLPTTDLYTAEYKELDNIVQGNVNTRYIEVTKQGYYQIFIQNMKKGGLVSEAVEFDIPVLAYNASTFELPEAYELLKDTSDELEITWYDTPEHFSSMILSYENNEGVGVDSSIIYANEDTGELDNTILEKVVTDNQIVLTVTYLPENGLNEVVNVSSEGAGNLIVPGNASETPISTISLNPGYNEERGAYVKATWNVTWPDYGGSYDESTFRARSLRLYYGLSSEKTAEYIDLPSLTTEEWYVENLDPDLIYKIDLVSVTEDGTISKRTSETVTTYNADTYNYDSCPEAKAVLLEGEVTFEWGLDFDSALQSVTFTCSGIERTTAASNGYVASTVIDGTGFATGSTYTYDYAIFCPEGGLDEIVVDINESCSIVVPDIVYDAIYEVCTIYSNDGFQAFADLVNGEKNYSAQTYGMNGDFLEFGTPYTSLDANLYCDIDISSNCAESSYGWYPIGGAYSGTFDGQGNSISGLFINRPEGTYQGLFKYLTAGTIKNLTLVNPYAITGDFSGLLVGQMAYSTVAAVVDNCHVIGGSIVNDEGEDGTATNISLGSITSRNYGSIIKDCSSSATVYIPTDQGANNSNNGVGGICGVNTRSGTTSPYGEIVGCEFSGIVFGQISAAGIAAVNTGGYVAGCTNYGFIKGGSYVGGVVGFNTGTAIAVASVNHGNILGSGGLTAGTIGRQAAYMHGCYNTGVYVCTNTSQITIGLITGYSPENAGVATGNTSGNYYYYDKYKVVDFLKSLYSDGYITTIVDYEQIITGEEDEDEETSLPFRYNVYWAFGGTVSNSPGTDYTGAGQGAASITALNTAVNAMNSASASTVWASYFASGSFTATYTYYFMPGASATTDYPYPVQY